jgi:hypothetical protein
MIPETGNRKDFKQATWRECANLPVVGGRYVFKALCAVLEVVEDHGTYMSCHVLESWGSCFTAESHSLTARKTKDWLDSAQKGYITRIFP